MTRNHMGTGTGAGTVTGTGPWVLVLLTVLGCADAGILPNPLDALPFKLPTFKLPTFKLPSFITDMPKHASNLIGKLVPQPIKNLLNFDPAPEWVPHPEDFDGEGYQADQARANQDETEEDDIHNQEEKGNLHGFGRDVIRSLTNQLNITIGLDTDKNFFSGVINGFKEHVKAIYPGTQWCGDGNIARSQKDLGLFYKTDSCCREHDSCPFFLAADEMKYGLYNKGLFTRSHCDCDRKFYKCLKDANDMVASQVGFAYFTILGPQCFKEEFPVTDCKIRFSSRCIEYDFQNTSQKVYQWFDNPNF